jgi:hypothetical protein
MQSLQPEQQQVVASTVFKRMGQATAGNQNAAGDVFSPETFLTNYNKMSPEAKSALFDRIPELRTQADNLANVAENLREGSKVFKNSSGTAGAESQSEMFKHLVSLGAGAVMGHGGGSPGAIAGAGAALVGVPSTAYMLSKALTSPNVVNWAARPAIGSSAQAASLSAAPRNLSSDDDTRRRLMRMLSQQP